MKSQSELMLDALRELPHDDLVLIAYANACTASALIGAIGNAKIAVAQPPGLSREQSMRLDRVSNRLHDRHQKMIVDQGKNN